MIRIRHKLMLFVAVALVATAAPAGACSCAPQDPRTELRQSDAAIIGTLVSKTPADDYGSIYKFTVDEEVKGDFGDTVDVRSASDGAACGLEVGVGRQTGLFLSGSASTGWSSSLCAQIHPDDLREAARPMPAPDGEGPIAAIAGGKWGEMGLFALDSEGRTLMYGKRRGGSSVADVCPGSSVFIEVPWSGERRWVLRRTSNFEVVEVVRPPRGAWPETCLSADGSDVLVYAVRYGEPISKSRLYRYHDGAFEKLYEGSSSWFQVVGEHVYLTEGRYGRNVRVLDLATGEKTFVARLPRYVQGVVASPDESLLAATAGADRETLVVIDRTTSPATVRTKDHGIGRSGELYWLDDSRFVYLPGGYDNSTVKVFDAELKVVKTFEGSWYTLDEDVAGGVAYGAGWGVLYRAALPDGPAEVLREFPTPDIYSIAVVPDEIFAEEQ